MIKKNHDKLQFKTLDNIDLNGKFVLVRVDINSPIDPYTEKIMNEFRIKAILDTLKELANSKTVLLAHQSRPGSKDFISLSSHTDLLKKHINNKVTFIPDIIGPVAINAIKNLNNGEILVLDNIRFLSEETNKKFAAEDTIMVKKLSNLFDVYVNDAFASVHRNHTSLIGFPKKIPSCIGRLVEREIISIKKILAKGSNKQIFVMGGAKPDDRIQVMDYVLNNKKTESRFLLGGVLAKVFLKARNQKLSTIITNELEEYQDIIPLAKKLIAKHNEKIILPLDYAYEENGERIERKIDAIQQTHNIFDVGDKTIGLFKQNIEDADVIVTNGPLGLMENPLFVKGTKEILGFISKNKSFNVAGGGHMTTMVEKEGLIDKFDHVSTGGGALLHMLSGKIPDPLKMLKI